MNLFPVCRSVGVFLLCAACLAVASASTGAGLTPGFGCGLGSAYATIGMSGSFGSDHLRAEIAIGTEPFVWSPTYAAGATVMFLDPKARVRPRLSLFAKSNASAVTVWEPEVQGEIQSDVEYEPYAGIAALGGVEIRLFEKEMSSFWLVLAVGYQTPFAGMDDVNRKADEFVSKYTTQHEIGIPRLEHFTFSVGLNVRLEEFQL